MYGVMLGLGLFLELDKGFRCLPGVKWIWMDENTAMPNYANKKTNLSFLTHLIEQHFFLGERILPQNTVYQTDRVPDATSKILHSKSVCFVTALVVKSKSTNKTTNHSLVNRESSTVGSSCILTGTTWCSLLLRGLMETDYPHLAIFRP